MFSADLSYRAARLRVIPGERCVDSGFESWVNVQRPLSVFCSIASRNINKHPPAPARQIACAQELVAGSKLKNLGIQQ
jgi:hypothetical protein